MGDLPNKIRVRVVKNKQTGVFLANLPEYDIFTESDSYSGLIFQVNDLIYTYFDIPKKLHGKVWYMPHFSTSGEVQKPSVNPILFNMLTSQNIPSVINGII